MLSRRQFNYSLALALPGLLRVHRRSAPLRVLVVDGINNHDWRRATSGISRILSRAGLFTVEVSTSHPREALGKGGDFWNRGFSRYDVIVNNFNGGESDQGIQWPDRIEQALETYLRGGGGLVVWDAANNAFLPWAAYNQMIGLGWR